MLRNNKTEISRTTERSVVNRSTLSNLYLLFDSLFFFMLGSDPCHHNVGLRFRLVEHGRQTKFCIIKHADPHLHIIYFSNQLTGRFLHRYAPFILHFWRNHFH